jgi:hypothetical protein
MTAHGLRRLLAVLTLLPALSFATPSETVSVEALGSGSSRDEAIAAALTQAVLQVQGKQATARELQDMFLKSMREERMIRMTVLNDYRIRATRLSTAVAFVQDYQVQESVRAKDDGEWQARVSADVVDPQKRLAKRQERLSLAVLPFQFMQEEEAEVGGPEVQMLVQKTLAEISSFRSLLTRKLDGHERIDIRDAPADAALAAAVENPGEAAWPSFTKLTGARNFVTVQAEEFRLDAVELRKGVKSGRLDGKFVLHYRILRNTGEKPEILKSGTFTVDTHHPQLRPLAMGDGNVSDAVLNQRVRAGFETVGRLFAATLLGELVPPDVVAREGDNILLKSGAMPLRAGEQLAVLGPDIIEPDAATGLLMRQDGIRIAILQVTSADNGRILAKVVKGSVFGVQPGSLLRRMSAQVAATEAHKASPEVAGAH